MSAGTVLVIDDSIMIRKMVTSILGDRFGVIEAKDGMIGLELARQHHPDLILLDFVMPKMDGYDTMQAIRAEDDLKQIPIIMMSGLKEQVTARIPEPFVGFDFIEKPFEAEALIGRIQQSLQIVAGSPESQALLAEPTLELLVAKLSSLESLLVQGTESLIQREVSSRLNTIEGRLEQQDVASITLEQKIDWMIGELQRHNKGLVVIVNEVRQIKKFLQSRIKPH
jgi:DNA-binding response OmpR family regulator